MFCLSSTQEVCNVLKPIYGYAPQWDNVCAFDLRSLLQVPENLENCTSLGYIHNEMCSYNQHCSVTQPHHSTCLMYACDVDNTQKGPSCNMRWSKGSVLQCLVIIYHASIHKSVCEKLTETTLLLTCHKRKELNT